MTIDRSTLEVLQPLVAAARDELADMEKDDIPSALRKAARSSARTLPPPLARSVVSAMIKSNAFRASVAQRYMERGTTNEDLLAFLDEPEAAMEQIGVRGAALAEDDMMSNLEDARQRIRDLESQITEAKRRNTALRARQRGEIAAARSSISDGQIRAEARLARMAGVLSESQDNVSNLFLEVAALTAELASTEERLASAVEKSRRRSGTGGHSGQRGRIDSTPSDPLDLAIWLDSVERNVRPFRAKGPPATENAGIEPLRIEHGVAPDSASALASLVDQHPRRFLIDGYNIAGVIHAGGFATRVARDDVVQRVGRLARSTDADVLIVFDGPDDDGRSGFQTTDGVLVRFSRGDKADDVIAALVASDPTRTVVITNDRDLRERCTVEGCIPIWSTALVEWL